MTKVIELIERQQKGTENTPVFMVGEQLKEIALREPKSAEILEKDLETSGMGIADAEKELKKYADANKGKSNCFCVSPKVAEGILRKFYGLEKRDTLHAGASAFGRYDKEGALPLETGTARNDGGAKIDLSDFL